MRVSPHTAFYRFLKRLEAIPPFPLQELLWFDLYFSAPIRLLIVLRQSITLASYLIPFLVPMIFIHPYTLRCSM